MGGSRRNPQFSRRRGRPSSLENRSQSSTPIMGTPRASNYVLVTPARNEEAYLEKTIESVVAQTIHPLKWVIVSDGSLDRTDEIARRYASRFQFIQFERVGEPAQAGKKDFGAKVRAFR